MNMSCHYCGLIATLLEEETHKCFCRRFCQIANFYMDGKTKYTIKSTSKKAVKKKKKKRGLGPRPLGIPQTLWTRIKKFDNNYRAAPGKTSTVEAHKQLEVNLEQLYTLYEKEEAYYEFQQRRIKTLREKWQHEIDERNLSEQLSELRTLPDAKEEDIERLNARILATQHIIATSIESLRLIDETLTVLSTVLSMPIEYRGKHKVLPKLIEIVAEKKNSIGQFMAEFALRYDFYLKKKPAKIVEEMVISDVTMMGEQPTFIPVRLWTMIRALDRVFKESPEAYETRQLYTTISAELAKLDRHHMLMSHYYRDQLKLRGFEEMLVAYKEKIEKDKKQIDALRLNPDTLENRHRIVELKWKLVTTEQIKDDLLAHIESIKQTIEEDAKELGEPLVWVGSEKDLEKLVTGGEIIKIQIREFILLFETTYSLPKEIITIEDEEESPIYGESPRYEEEGEVVMVAIEPEKPGLPSTIEFKLMPVETCTLPPEVRPIEVVVGMSQKQLDLFNKVKARAQSLSAKVAPMSQQIQDYFRRAQLIMHFPSLEIFEKMVPCQDAHLRNFFETGKNRGSPVLAARINWEKKIFVFPEYELFTDFEKVKYGSINLSYAQQGIERLARTYGYSYFIFKEEVRNRCTVTWRDSSSPSTAAENVGTFDYYNHVLASMTSEEKKYIEGPSRCPKTNPFHKEYVEVQYHGELYIPRDVEKIMISNIYKKEKLFPNLIKMFLNTIKAPDLKWEFIPDA